MSELILCKRPIAAVGYYIEESSLNIYSLEELSYYMYHNMYLINDDIINASLCNWIGREFDLKDLEHELLDFIAEDVPHHVFVSHLLDKIGYLSANEIKQIVDVVSAFENKSEAEVKKIRADRLLDKGKVVDAIYQYENILEKYREKKLSKELEGDIWHNLGVCYAKLFFFTEAAVCFEYAYQHNKRRESLEHLLICYRCKKDDEGFKMQAKKYYVPDEMSERIMKYVSDTAQGSEVMDFDNRLRNLRMDYEQEENYLKELGNIISKWKSGYINSVKI